MSALPAGPPLKAFATVPVPLEEYRALYAVYLESEVLVIALEPPVSKAAFIRPQLQRLRAAIEAYKAVRK